MKICSQVKLQTSKEEKEILLKTMKEFNEVCNGISESSFESGVFKQFDLHKILYHPIRDCFNLPSQLVIRAISKVADSYKIDQKKNEKI